MSKKELILQTSDLFIQQRNLDIIKKSYSSNYIAHAGNKTYKGHRFLKMYSKQIHRAIPDLKIIKIEFLILTDTLLTWQRTFTGTHMHSLKGIPASMKKITWYEIVVSRFENDKIAEEWIASDLAFQLMLKQSN